MTPARPDSLRFGIDVPPQVREGEPVPIALRVTNVSDNTVELNLQGRTIAFDLTITAADGSVVWHRLEGETIEAILRIEPLASGAVLELNDTWDQRTNRGEQVRPGLYVVAATLPTDSAEPLRIPPAPLRIVPR